METPIDSKVSKPEIVEADIYFNNLLRSQSEETSSTKKTKFKPVTLIILFTIITAGLYFAVTFYINATNIAPTTAIDTSVVESNTAYFNPSYYSNTSRKLTGRIDNNFDSKDDKRLGFELLANDGKTIAYLYSDNNDLKLSVGLTVEIQGEYKGNAFDNKEIIEVKSIRLK